jgi:hypothetical protein
MTARLMMLEQVPSRRKTDYGAESGVDAVIMEGQPAGEGNATLLLQNNSYPFDLTELISP